jgi:hypothetical protein
MHSLARSFECRPGTIRCRRLTDSGLLIRFTEPNDITTLGGKADSGQDRNAGLDKRSVVIALVGTSVYSIRTEVETGRALPFPGHHAIVAPALSDGAPMTAND